MTVLPVIKVNAVISLYIQYIALMCVVMNTIEALQTRAELIQRVFVPLVSLIMIKLPYFITRLDLDWLRKHHIYSTMVYIAHSIEEQC